MAAPSQSVDFLNAHYAKPSHVSFEQTAATKGGLIIARLSLNSPIQCMIFLHGAHVASVTDHRGHELLFMSSKTNYSLTSALRGGVPVIFPQFGPNALPNLKAMPQHGFARASNDWQVTASSAAQTKVSLTLELRDTESSRAHWDNNKFILIMTVTISYSSEQGFSFHQELKVKNLNTDDKPFHFTSALHTYFAIQDIANVTVGNLKGSSYPDKFNGGVVVKEEKEDVGFDKETDRTYGNVSDDLTIKEGGKEVYSIHKTGFSDVVVWNIWSEKAKNMADLGEGEWKKYVCAEVAQASAPVLLAANSEWIGSQTIKTK